MVLMKYRLKHFLTFNSTTLEDIKNDKMMFIDNVKEKCNNAMYPEHVSYVNKEFDVQISNIKESIKVNIYYLTKC